jgi:hypothetical protein
VLPSPQPAHGKHHGSIVKLSALLQASVKVNTSQIKSIMQREALQREAS